MILLGDRRTRVRKMLGSLPVRSVRLDAIQSAFAPVQLYEHDPSLVVTQRETAGTHRHHDVRDQYAGSAVCKRNGNDALSARAVAIDEKDAVLSDRPVRAVAGQNRFNQ